jgi:hypothetical protein
MHAHEEGRGRHRNYPDDPDIYFFPAELQRDLWGRAYEEKRAKVGWRCVDFSYQTNKFTRAYCRDLPLENHLREKMHRYADALPAVKPGDEYKDTRVPKSDLDALCAGIGAKSTGHRRSCAMFRAGCVDNGDGTATNRAIYRRVGNHGRRYAMGIGLQNLPRYIRDLLLPKTHASVDMTCAQPTLLSQLVSGEYPRLRALVESPATVRAALAEHYGVDVKSAKTALTGALFGVGDAKLRKILGRSPDDEFLQGLREEADDILDELGLEGTPYWERALDSVLRKHSRAPPALLHRRTRFSALAHLLQDAEDQCLQACEDWHRRRGEFVSVLLFDGYYVEAELSAEDIADLEEHVRALTGFSIGIRYSSRA